MKFKAGTHPGLKKSVLDSQEQTTLHALETMGFREAKSLRTGKYFEMQLESADRKQAEAGIHAIGDKVRLPVAELRPVFDNVIPSVMERK